MSTTNDFKDQETKTLQILRTTSHITEAQLSLTPLKTREAAWDLGFLTGLALAYNRPDAARSYIDASHDLIALVMPALSQLTQQAEKKVIDRLADKIEETATNN